MVKASWLGLVLILLASCGRAPVVKTSAVTGSVLELKAAGYKALLQWNAGPDSKLAAGSEYTLKFFPVTGKVEGPYSNPPAEVTTLPQMACCGAPSAPKSFAQTEPGVFAAKGVTFLKGDWKIVVTLLDAAKKKIDSAELLVSVP